jgi:hypothetical protein
MTDQSATWTRKFKKHYAANIERLGGASITPHRRTVAKQAAVFQVELDRLAQRFAAGNGATSEDLRLYTQISSTVQQLFESSGYTPAVAVNRKADEEERATLARTMVDALDRIRRARQDGQGTAVIIDNTNEEHPQPPAEVHRAIEQPPPRSTPRLVVEPPKPEPSPPRQLTPAEAKQKAMESQPQPSSGEPSNTQLALEWMSGGGRMRWEPPPGW